MAKLNTFVVSVTSAVGVNVPVQVMPLSFEVIVVNEPFCTVISSPELNPVTASLNVSVTVASSPDLSA